MKLWTISDLHLRPRECSNFREFAVDGIDVIPDADVCVIAGDIANGAPEVSIEWLAKHIQPHMPVVITLGNHDFYGENLHEARQAARRAADEHGIHLLDDSSVTIAGVRFVGSTLWTDYFLYAGDDPETITDLRRGYMNAARVSLADHGEITLQPGRMDLFKPLHAAELHAFSRDFLNRELDKDHDGQTVVVTHHAPHPNSIAAEFAGDELTPAFVSDLSELIERHQPDLWIHGHTHTKFDYEIGDTRVVCNPRGYYYEQDYDPALVIDISRWGPKPPGW